MLWGKSIFKLELRSKVADNELYTSKLTKEKEQLQKKITSLEEHSIKETACSSIGLQFNYLIPSMGMYYYMNNQIYILYN